MKTAALFLALFLSGCGEDRSAKAVGRLVSECTGTVTMEATVSAFGNSMMVRCEFKPKEPS